MVICMALLAPAHPYFGLSNHGRAVKAGATPFADDATVTEMSGTGHTASKQTV